jgi:aromatase
MDTSIECSFRADPRKVFGLVAAVEDWPRILPHYRSVRILATHSAHARTVEMAARRDVIGRFGIPLRWTAVQRLYPAEARIEFEHIGGITRGMRVAWTISADSTDGSMLLVRIRHLFEPRWPVPDGLVQAVVGEYFVNAVARRTLRRVSELAQWPT